jgi:hypothetical protein
MTCPFKNKLFAPARLARHLRIEVLERKSEADAPRERKQDHSAETRWAILSLYGQKNKLWRVRSEINAVALADCRIMTAAAAAMRWTAWFSDVLGDRPSQA